jgi:MATE family multidrug resistance protein
MASLESSEGLKSSQPSPLAWEAQPARSLVKLAWPIMVSTLSYSVMTLVDTLLVGRLGPAALAGVGLGGTAAFVFLCFSFGLLRAAKTLVAQALGAGRRDQVGAYLGAALVWAAGIGVVTVVLGEIAAPLVGRISKDPAAGAAAHTYLAIRILGAPFALAYVALREVRYGQSDARSAMVATVAANLVNIGLAWTFINVFHWGVAGAAWATVVAHMVEAGMLAWQQHGDGWGVRAMRASHLRAVWRIGVPTGLQFTLEVGSFALLAALIARMGTLQMAAHQIALQVVHFAFLPGLALSEAASVLAGQAVGARRLELVRRVAHVSLAVTVGYGLLCTLVIGPGASLIARGFTDDPALAGVAVHLLWIAALFNVFDGANVTARGILRGAGDVRVPAVVGVLTAWVSTPPLTYLLGDVAGLGAVGGWLGLTAEILAATAILWWRLERGTWHAAALASRRELEAAGAEGEATLSGQAVAV